MIGMLRFPFPGSPVSTVCFFSCVRIDLFFFPFSFPRAFPHSCSKSVSWAFLFFFDYTFPSFFLFFDGDGLRRAPASPFPCGGKERTLLSRPSGSVCSPFFSFLERKELPSCGEIQQAYPPPLFAFSLLCTSTSFFFPFKLTDRSFSYRLRMGKRPLF